MRKSYHLAYRYLFLCIVLSFIDSKYSFVNCQKARSRMRSEEGEVPCGDEYPDGYPDGYRGRFPARCNGTALARTSAGFGENKTHGVTCYICVNVSDNHVCNKYAIDKPCKLGDDFCHTLHIMDPNGKSLLVNKKCANQTECTPHTIGCYDIDNQKICISCCDEDYCNRRVPTQTSNATFKNSRTLRQKLLDAGNKNKSEVVDRSGSSRGANPTTAWFPVGLVVAVFRLLLE